jgi:hypothetical protein
MIVFSRDGRNTAVLRYNGDSILISFVCHVIEFNCGTIPKLITEKNIFGVDYTTRQHRVHFLSIWDEPIMNSLAADILAQSPATEASGTSRFHFKVAAGAG